MGDLVVAVDGGKVLLVFREMNNVGHHENGGRMGLASQWAGDGKLAKRDFSLI